MNVLSPRRWKNLSTQQPIQNWVTSWLGLLPQDYTFLQGGRLGKREEFSHGKHSPLALARCQISRTTLQKGFCILSWEKISFWIGLTRIPTRSSGSSCDTQIDWCQDHCWRFGNGASAGPINRRIDEDLSGNEEKIYRVQELIPGVHHRRQGRGEDQ